MQQANRLKTKAGMQNGVFAASCRHCLKSRANKTGKVIWFVVVQVISNEKVQGKQKW